MTVIDKPGKYFRSISLNYEPVIISKGLTWNHSFDNISTSRYKGI